VPRIAPIKVLIVDDSALIRQMLARALELDPRIEIVGVAKNGVEAIEKARTLKPDVITLDIEMPKLTGLEALPFISKQTAARIIMLSSVDDPDTTYQALAGGAVDFISKPKGGFATSLSELSDMLIKKIKIAYRVPPSKVRDACELAVGVIAPPILGEDVGPRATRFSTLVVIAASTGGPPALEKVFSGLSASLSAAFLVVQHLPSGFSGSFARRLGKVTDIEVNEARAGDIIEPGAAYLAPYGRHMKVYHDHADRLRIALEEGPSIHGVIPSADPLMVSAARDFDRVVGVLLTGMGSDGADGLKAVRDSDGCTIVQDEATSVVWGMPGAAVNMGVASKVVPLDQIAVEIRRAVRGCGSNG